MSLNISQNQLDVLEFIYKQEDEIVAKDLLEGNFGQETIENLKSVDLIGFEDDTQSYCLTDKSYDVDFDLGQNESLFSKKPLESDLKLYSYFQDRFGALGWIVISVTVSVSLILIAIAVNALDLF